MIARLTELLKDAYANYFIQQLFLFLNESFQHEIIVEILNNFSALSEDPTALSAITSMIGSTSMRKATQDLLISFIKKFDSEEYLTNFRLLKVLEAILDSFEESDAEFIISFVIEKFNKLYKLRPGFFLIRKLIKYCKSLSIQMSIVDQIESCIDSFPYTGNGSLLCQCLIRNFSISLLGKRHKSALSSLELNLSKMKNFKSNYISKTKPQTEESLEDGEPENDIHLHFENPALLSFFNLLISKVLPYELNKHSSKVLECSLKYGGSEFQNKFTQIVREKSYDTITGIKLLRYLLSTERGTKFISSAFEHMKPENKMILELRIREIQYKPSIQEQQSKHSFKKELYEDMNNISQPKSHRKVKMTENAVKIDSFDHLKYSISHQVDKSIKVNALGKGARALKSI